MDVILAIEMSQRVGGVAARDRSGRVDVELLAPKKRHDDDFMPAIDRLLKRMSIAPSELEGLGVSIGPGGFTGLRIAISASKMLAETLSLQIAAVPSALVAAESSCGPAQESRSVIVALASKNDSAWCTTVRYREGRWESSGEAGLHDAKSIQLTEIDLVLADEHLPADIRDRCHREKIGIISPTFDPRACLAIAARMLQQGKTIDPLLLQPLYPRKPEAVSLWEKRKARA